MTTILIKDSLRQSIEAASGGAQTVIYTSKGQPTFMNIVEKYDLSIIDAELSGIHPAFVVNGVVKDVIYIGTYSGVIRNGEVLSLPNVAPQHTTNFSTWLSAVRSNNAGHHIMTGVEWSALALKAYKDGVVPLGNTYYGRSADDAAQFGRRVDGVNPTAGVTTGNGQILTGSGPVSFRHNRKYNGISDMAGNVRSYCAGVRIFKGELQIIQDNNAAITSTDLTSTSASWKAIHALTGELITPDGNGTTAYSVKYSTTLADYTILVPSDTFLQKIGALTNPSANSVASAVIKKLQVLGLYPMAVGADKYNNDNFKLGTTDESLLCVGGGWNSGLSGGIFNVDFVERGRLDNSVTVRPAFYNP